ncbi:YbaB/EbfC family nucleoid-associated protein [bacterium]|nr:YbaB/EbfC family nucleoid-associated protein [bacterium]
MTGEMKIRDFKINDKALLDPSKKEELEELVVKAFQKAQNKAQEVAAEKTKEVLGFDPSNLAAMM